AVVVGAAVVVGVAVVGVAVAAGAVSWPPPEPQAPAIKARASPIAIGPNEVCRMVPALQSGRTP
nr:hypothetical protein [Acidimicrobiales bacterium]